MAPNMAAYTPGSWLKSIHEFPRWDVTSGMKTAPNTFDPDVQGTGKSYFMGVLSVSGIYFALAVLFLLAFGITYLVGCCCRSKKRKLLEARGCCKRLCSNLFGPRPWMLAAIVLMVAMTAASLSNQGISKVRDGVTELGQDLDALKGAMSTADVALTGSLIPSLTSFGNSASAALSAAQYNNASLALQSGLQTLASGVASANTDANNAHSYLSSTINMIDTKIRGGSINPEDLGQKVFLGGVIVLSVFLAFLVMLTLTLIPTSCCAGFFRFCTAFIWLALVLCWVGAGLFLAISMVGSDVCIDPPTALKKIAVYAGASSDAVDTLDYYTTCGPQSAPVPEGAILQVLDAQSALQTASADLSNLTTALAGTSWGASFATDLTTAAASTNTGMSSVVAASACGALYPVYLSLADDVCNNAITGSALVFALITVAAIAFVIVGVASARLCFRHPGDPVGPAGSAAAAGGKDGGDYKLPTVNPAGYGGTPGYAYNAGAPAQYADWSPGRR